MTAGTPPIAPGGEPNMAWMLLASCRTARHLPWLGGRREPPAEVVEEMRSVCDSCPVRHHCADFVDAAEVVGGFWAGRWRSDEETADPHDDAA